MPQSSRTILTFAAWLSQRASSVLLPSANACEANINTKQKPNAVTRVRIATDHRPPTTDNCLSMATIYCESGGDTNAGLKGSLPCRFCLWPGDGIHFVGDAIAEPILVQVEMGAALKIFDLCVAAEFFELGIKELHSFI